MLDVAVDNSVLSLYAAKTVRNSNLKMDRKAFEEMISLSQQGKIELGGPWTILAIENLMKSGECRENAQKLKGIIKYWPVPDPDQKKTNEQTRCLHRIMRDRGATDSRQIVLISRCTQARHFVTVDYSFFCEFNRRRKDIVRQCGVNIFVLTPLDFMKDWKLGKI